jgi:hypothetical protein
MILGWGAVNAKPAIQMKQTINSPTTARRRLCCLAFVNILQFEEIQHFRQGKYITLFLYSHFNYDQQMYFKRRAFEQIF